MAAIDKATLTAATGFGFVAPSGTALPDNAMTADLVGTALGTATGADLLSGWSLMSTMSKKNLPKPGNDGGDKKMDGTWDGLVTRSKQTEASIDYIDMSPTQFDSQVLAMHFGKGVYDKTKKFFDILDVGKSPVQMAFILYLVDGPIRVGFHVFNCDFSRADGMSLDSEQFAELPVRVTFLKVPGKAYTMRWFGIEDGAPTTTATATK